jgi:hypothetical protein
MVSQTDQPYVFTNDSPLNATDPLGLSIGGANGESCISLSACSNSSVQARNQAIWNTAADANAAFWAGVAAALAFQRALAGQASNSKGRSEPVAGASSLPDGQTATSGGSSINFVEHIATVALGPSATWAARVILNENDFSLARKVYVAGQYWWESAKPQFTDLGDFIDPILEGSGNIPPP